MSTPPLISAKDAIACFDDDNTVFLDAGFHMPNSERDAKAEFIEKRIKGAMWFDINAIALPDSDYPHTMPTAPLFQRHMQVMGLMQQSHVIIYDNCPTFPSARVWFMFRYFGFDRVQVINGGLNAWEAAGGAVTFGAAEESHSRGDFTTNDPIETDGVLSVHSMKRLVQKPTSKRRRQIIDARPEDRFYGRIAEPRGGLASGHMPGAMNIPFNNLIDPDTGMIKSKEELVVIFAELDAEKQIVTTCGSGVTACLLLLGLAVIGRKDVAIYDGSWTEWGSREDCPVSV